MLRYYPSFKIIANQTTSGGEFSLNGFPYVGSYYTTYDNRAFTGPSPEIGPNEVLRVIQKPTFATVTPDFNSIPVINQPPIIDLEPEEEPIFFGGPVSYYPEPIEDDYTKGYIIRYFTKKENNRGFITEISEDQYNAIVNGTANFDITLYQVTKILWKLTGPLNNTRKSQYNVIPGIIDTNKRLTESANNNFLGIVDFIGGEYTKFANPTI